MVPSDTGFDLHYHLACGGMHVNSTHAPSWMEVHIKQLKCDKFAQGVSLFDRATGTYQHLACGCYVGIFGAECLNCHYRVFLVYSNQPFSPPPVRFQNAHVTNEIRVTPLLN